MWFEYAKQNLFIGFILLFFLFYIACIQKDINKTFFFMLILSMGFVFWMHNNNNKNKDEGKQSVGSIIEDLEGLTKDFPTGGLLYNIETPPTILKYIRRNETMKKLMFDMRESLAFNQTSFVSLVIYLEYFLKFHFLVMTGYYKNINIYTEILRVIIDRISY